jgi:hypothetical protein
MPRVNVPVTALSRSGIAPPSETNGDAANGHRVANTGQTIVVVRNSSADTAYDVTFVTPGTVDGQPVGDRVVEVPADTTRWFGRFSPGVYGTALLLNVENTALKLSALEP